MAEEEPKQLSYIPEIVLKRRKTNEEFALRRKEQLEQRRLASKKNKEGYIKLPDEFVREYRAKELDLIQMKHRSKRKRPEQLAANSKLLFVIRIQGKNDMHLKTRKVLNSLRLRKIFDAVFVRSSESNMEKLQMVEPYITYGYPNLNNIRELVYKKGFAKVDQQRVPLTDNNFIEQELGKYNIICIEDIVNEIASVGPHFKEVTRFLWPFSLEKPEGVLQGKKSSFKEGGDAGNREDRINELIVKMN